MRTYSNIEFFIMIILLGLIPPPSRSQNVDLIEEIKLRTTQIINNHDGELERCSGFLISDRFILTCAHAVSVYYEKDTIINYGSGVTIKSYVQKFVSGASPESIIVKRGNGENLRVDNVFIYPGYASNNNFDIAILELKESLKIEDKFQNKIKKPTVGDTIMCLGFSKESLSRSPKSQSQEDLLRWFNIVTKVDDTDNYNFETIQLELSTIGDYKFGRITEPGDSGGPSFILDGNNLYLTGIHSEGVTMLLNPDGTTPNEFIPFSIDVSIIHFENWISAVIHNKF